MSRIRYMIFALALGLFSLTAFAVPVDINTADAKTLATELNGIGATRAEAIVSYREKHGPFKQVEDLLQVKGIGPAILDKNRNDIVVKSE